MLRTLLLGTVASVALVGLLTFNNDVEVASAQRGPNMQSRIQAIVWSETDSGEVVEVLLTDDISAQATVLEHRSSGDKTLTLQVFNMDDPRYKLALRVLDSELPQKDAQALSPRR